MKIGITGGTGFIGKPLIARLVSSGHSVRAWVRNTEAASSLPCELVQWDGKPENLNPESFKGLDAIINLAGAPVAGKRWSPEVKKSILNSRVQTTQACVEAMAKLPKEQRPLRFISASAIGFYGDRQDELLDESSSKGTGFLSDVTEAWEQAAQEAKPLGVHVVCPRLGVVLGRNGGALEKMQPIPLGDGKQWMSWIHLHDLIELFVFLLEKTEISGPVNAVAPQPVRNADFAKVQAHVRGWMMSVPIGAPKLALNLALGEMSSVVLASQNVSCKLALSYGFKFAFPELEPALRDLEDGDEEWLSWQVIRRPTAEVFKFFSVAENLEELTPPTLNFKILNQSTPTIQTGTLIDYRLKIHGVPVHWKTEILNWTPDREFVDFQLKGPYTKWHHTHQFTEIPGGTLMTDRVRYRLPIGSVGKAFGGGFVKKDIHSIFAYRRTVIERLFG